MRILVTNDDGIDAPGLRLLRGVAARLGDVWVVAPDRERSGVSHAITLFKPLRIEQVRPQEFACSGTPTDCVYLAINQMKLNFDLVLSGINAGPNLGHDVLYSGTVGGALEGAHWGVPSIAISHCSGDLRLLERTADTVAEVISATIPIATQLQRAVNVNLPPADRMPYAGVQATKLGHRVYSNEVHERIDPRGRNYYWLGGAKVMMKDIPGSDCNAVRDNFISVTPLGDDLTLHAGMATTRDQLADRDFHHLGVSGQSTDLPELTGSTTGFPFE
jgi:5'-nucleotidase